MPGRGNDSLTASLRLDEPDRAEESPLAQIVSSHLRSRGRSQPFQMPRLDSLWDAAYFGLDRVKLFQAATDDQQREILAGCARNLLNEAYFIEKSGMAYCAKMILLADTTAVRQVYGLIAADEASHLQWLRPFVAEADRGQPRGHLLQFLPELIEHCDMNTLAFLVQIILEGWGLSHYRSLSQHCRQPELRDVFHAIHRDEALHHHTGEVVFDPALVVSAAQRQLIEESLHDYTQMVRVGPQAVVGVVDRVLGGLAKKDKVAVFAELQTESQSREKLKLLRELMWGPGRESYVLKLDEQDGFTPYAPEVCATVPG